LPDGFNIASPGDDTNRSMITPAILYFLRRHDGTQQGPLTQNEIDKIFRRKKHDGYTGDSLYRRSQENEWKPLRTFSHFEFGERQSVQLDYMRRVGIKYVKWVSGGLPNECAACGKLNLTVFPIDAAPLMPPPRLPL
jgi:hypothetical protein